MVYNKEIAFGLLCARLDRAGVTLPQVQQEYYRQRLEAAALELERKGIHLADDLDDNLFLADYAAWKLQNRDRQGDAPMWLKQELRSRWLSMKGRDAGGA